MVVIRAPAAAALGYPFGSCAADGDDLTLDRSQTTTLITVRSPPSGEGGHPPQTAHHLTTGHDRDKTSLSRSRSVLPCGGRVVGALVWLEAVDEESDGGPEMASVPRGVSRPRYAWFGSVSCRHVDDRRARVGLVGGLAAEGQMRSFGAVAAHPPASSREAGWGRTSPRPATDAPVIPPWVSGGGGGCPSPRSTRAERARPRRGRRGCGDGRARARGRGGRSPWAPPRRGPVSARGGRDPRCGGRLSVPLARAPRTPRSVRRIGPAAGRASSARSRPPGRLARGRTRPPPPAARRTGAAPGSPQRRVQRRSPVSCGPVSCGPSSLATATLGRCRRGRYPRREGGEAVGVDGRGRDHALEARPRRRARRRPTLRASRDRALDAPALCGGAAGLPSVLGRALAAATASCSGRVAGDRAGGSGPARGAGARGGLGRPMGCRRGWGLARRPVGALAPGGADAPFRAARAVSPGPPRGRRRQRRPARAPAGSAPVAAVRRARRHDGGVRRRWGCRRRGRHRAGGSRPRPPERRQASRSGAPPGRAPCPRCVGRSARAVRAARRRAGRPGATAASAWVPVAAAPAGLERPPFACGTRQAVGRAPGGVAPERAGA